MPTIADLDQIYANLYLSSSIISGQTNQESNDFALRQYAQYLSAKTLTNSMNVLDYGCGSGLLVQLLKENGFNAIGVERSDGARDFALRERGLTLHQDLSQISDGSVDAITMIEVIEHLLDPVMALKALRQKLRPGGLLFLTTPNIRGLRARIEAGHWREATKKFHIVFFDKNSIKRVLRAAGFFDSVQVRFSPIQQKGIGRRVVARLLQLIDLSGSLCFTARNSK